MIAPETKAEPKDWNKFWLTAAATMLAFEAIDGSHAYMCTSIWKLVAKRRVVLASRY